MKKKFLLILLMTKVVLADAALAADWWFVPGDEKLQSEVYVYVDKSSMERTGTGNRVKAWSWTLYRSDQISEFGAYRSDKVHLLVDCENKQAAADAGFLYSVSGRAIHQFYRSTQEPIAVPPQSPRASAIEFICSGGKQPFLSIPVYDPNRDAEQRIWLRERQAKPAG